MTTVRREPAKTPPDPGQVAYEAYADYVGWESVKGDPLPGFSQQAPRIQNAWRMAAEAVTAAADPDAYSMVSEPDPGPPGTVLEGG